MASVRFNKCALIWAGGVKDEMIESKLHIIVRNFDVRLGIS